MHPDLTWMNPQAKVSNHSNDIVLSQKNVFNSKSADSSENNVEYKKEKLSFVLSIILFIFKTNPCNRKK
jgi:hypothetical protein